MRILVCALLLLAACGGDPSGPPRQEVEGNWSGTFVSKGDVGHIQMTLQETNGSVTGDGNLSISDAVAVTITGTYSDPNVTLTLSSAGLKPVSLSGTVEGTSLSGTLNGSGFIGATVTMHR